MNTGVELFELVGAGGVPEGLGNQYGCPGQLPPALRSLLNAKFPRKAADRERKIFNHLAMVAVQKQGAGGDHRSS